MGKILILEDDTIQNQSLYRTLCDAYPSWMIHCAYSLSDAKELLSKSIQEQDYYSLFLLDVQLNDTSEKMGGFEFASIVRSQNVYFSVPILFLTSLTNHIGYALSNYHCYNYITKPYTTEDILFQIRQMLLTGFMEANAITITASNRIKHRIFQDDILFIEAKSHQILIKTNKGAIVSREMSFQSFSDLLNERFLQCHRKYIINTSKISNYDRTNHFVHMENTAIPVSRTYQDRLEALLE